MEKTLHILELTKDEERIAKAWAQAYGVTIEELFNLLINRLECYQVDILAAAERAIRAGLTLD